MFPGSPVPGLPFILPPNLSDFLASKLSGNILSLQILVQICLVIAATIGASHCGLASSRRGARGARRDVEDLVVDERTGGITGGAEAPEKFFAAECRVGG